MIPKYTYSDFKRKLCSNPKWIARGLSILNDGIPAAGPAAGKLLDSEELSIRVMVRQLAFAMDGGLPWTLDSNEGKDAILLVRRHAPAIYNYYVQLHRVIRDREKTT